MRIRREGEVGGVRLRWCQIRCPSRKCPEHMVVLGAREAIDRWVLIGSCPLSDADVFEEAMGQLGVGEAYEKLATVLGGPWDAMSERNVLWMANLLNRAKDEVWEAMLVVDVEHLERLRDLTLGNTADLWAALELLGQAHRRAMEGSAP